MTQLQTQTQDQTVTRDGAREFRGVLQDFALERSLCDRLVRTGKLPEAEASLQRARQLHDELIGAADQQNIIHRRMVRNRGIDLSLLSGQVESCRLKKQAAATRRKPRRAEEPPAEGA